MKPNSFIEKTLRFFKRFIPKRLFKTLAPIYHFKLAFLSALFYRFPTRKVKVVAVTGTKGKSTVTELVNAILEEAGYKTALSNTIRFKIGKREERNMFKMSMPGRFFLQRFFRKAVNAGCQWIVLEMTSQGVLTSRHRFINLDALIITNISPEHIEAHGSFENYVKAKLAIAKTLNRSRKHSTLLVANRDDEFYRDFIKVTPKARKAYYTLDDAEPKKVTSSGITLTFNGVKISSKLPGTFNVYNVLAAATFARNIGIDTDTIRKAIKPFMGVRGRLERIEPEDNALSKEQDFSVIVDYAHTPDSLEKVYKVFEGSRRICVLGNTGGGRDKWKRKEMAKIAENYCERIILTNEDPYDENPVDIVNEMAKAIIIPKYEIEMDRRAAIRKAIEYAESDDVVLITGKGTDPYIMGPRGSAEPWDDATVAREELNAMLEKRTEE